MAISLSILPLLGTRAVTGGEDAPSFVGELIGLPPSLDLLLETTAGEGSMLHYWHGGWDGTSMNCGLDATSREGFGRSVVLGEDAAAR